MTSPDEALRLAQNILAVEHPDWRAQELARAYLILQEEAKHESIIRAALQITLTEKERELTALRADCERLREENKRLLAASDFTHETWVSNLTAETARANAASALAAQRGEAIAEHDAGCVASCDAQDCGYKNKDGTFIYRRNCPTCPEDWMIDEKAIEATRKRRFAAMKESSK